MTATAMTATQHMATSHDSDGHNNDGHKLAVHSAQNCAFRSVYALYDVSVQQIRVHEEVLADFNGQTLNVCRQHEFWFKLLPFLRVSSTAAANDSSS